MVDWSEHRAAWAAWTPATCQQWAGLALAALLVGVLATACADSTPHWLDPASPQSLTVGQRAVVQAISPSAVHYYTFTTTATATHTIDLTLLESDLGWQLFNAADFTGLVISCDTSADTTDETCATGSLNIGTPFYLQVTNNDAQWSSYNLQVATP